MYVVTFHPVWAQSRISECVKGRLCILSLWLCLCCVLMFVSPSFVSRVPTSSSMIRARSSWVGGCLHYLLCTAPVWLKWVTRCKSEGSFNIFAFSFVHYLRTELASEVFCTGWEFILWCSGSNTIPLQYIVSFTSKILISVLIFLKKEY